MSQVYKQDNMTIHNADCMEIMAEYEDNYFDLAVVDPPYGIGESGGKSRTKKNRPNSHLSKYKHKKKSWDVRPHKDYFIELRRVSKNQIVWGGNYLIDLIGPESSSCWIIWDKNIGGDQADGELAYTTFKTAIRIFKGHPFIGTNGGKDRIHPTQKPIVLYNWIYANYAEHNQRILDTHLGSGSNAIAAHYAKMGEFVGCELDDDYFKSACERIRKETRQMELF